MHLESQRIPIQRDRRPIRFPDMQCDLRGVVVCYHRFLYAWSVYDRSEV